MTTRSTIDGVAPRRSTTEEWPERIVQPSPPVLEERAETTFTSPPLPLPTPSIEKAREISIGDASASSIFPTSTEERQLEFLGYLVKRGIVNEGFAEEEIPDQYRQQK